MARYRELGSNLEASYVVLWEFCGPTITYGRGLETLKPPRRTDIRTETNRTESPTDNKRTGRPKKWSSEAERLKAYRERSK